jgi:hypothetical protein
MPRIILDFDPPQPEAPEFTSDTSDLVYFLSWAYSARYGASHELSQAAQVLRNKHGLNLQPLLNFADRQAEDPADEDALERAWQDPAPLAASCSAVAEALATLDEEVLTTVREEYPALVENIADLGRIAAWAAEQGARIRVTYLLDDA